MGLLVKGGRVITHADDRRADVYCEGETISRIEPAIDPASLPDDTEVIDASGKYVFPGFIDPHVHVHLPFMGTHAKDDWASASKAALAGGTTSLIEMICPGPSDEPMDAFETWLGKAQGQAACDFSFHMAVVRFDDLAREQLRAIALERGIPSFKVFLAYKGALDLSDEHLFALLQMSKDLGSIVTAHCENAEAVDSVQKALLAQGKTGPEWHEPSRPTFVEAQGVTHLCAFAQLTGAHVYIVHTSCDDALTAALEARHRGVNVWIECVAPHLVLDKSFAERDGFEGAKYVMSPPLRENRNQDILWNEVRSRAISTIATDHAPFDFKGQKDMGREAFTKIPNGIPSVFERVNLMHTHGVCEGRIDLNTMVDACSTQAARIFGMYPAKGTIQVGADADLVVYDPEYRGEFSASDSPSLVDYSGYEGWEQRGRASVVTVRGKIQARDGAFVGETGSGRLIPRAATHA